MRKILLIISLLTLHVVSTQAQSKSAVTGQKTGYRIQAKVNGLSDSLCYLANYFGDKQYLRDSTHADASGKIVFKGDTALKGGIYMIVLPGKKYFELVVDKQQHFSVETSGDDYVANMKVTGSDDNILFYDYLRFINQKSKAIEPLRNQYEQSKSNPEQAASLRKQMAEIDSTVLKYRNNLMMSHPEFLLAAVIKATNDISMPEFAKNPDGSVDTVSQYYYYRDHFFDNVNLQDDRLLYTPVFHPKLEQFFTKLLLQIPDTLNMQADRIISKLKPGSELFKYVVWWVTNHYETSKIMGMDAVFVHMAKNYYTKEKAFWVDDAQLFKIQDRAKVLEPILLGKKVKNVVLNDSSGISRSLYDVKAKYTILFFWDPDCGHCKIATPKLKKYYDMVKDKGVQVFAVCTEVEMDKWKKFIKENHLDWINVADPELKNNFRYEFDISSTPQIFLLDSNKNIIAKRIEVETLTDVIQKEFKKVGIETPVLTKDESKHEGEEH